MKKHNKENIIIGVALILLSLFLHYVHYLLFKDLHHTLIFFVADLAFIPMDVVFTTLILDKFLENREKDQVLEKLNMLIGVFYMELGTDLLKEITTCDRKEGCFIVNGIVDNDWENKAFKELREYTMNYDYPVNFNVEKLIKIKHMLLEKKEFLISLIANQSLLEHETFTETLMSIIHISEELYGRCNNNIEPYEVEHLNKDISIAYRYLTIEWSYYMEYLRDNYPQLYLKALIDNPFDRRSKEEKDKIYLKLIKK